MQEKSNFFSSLIEKGQFRVDEKGHAVLFGEFLFMVPPKVILRLQDELEDRLGREEMEELMVELGLYQVEQASDRYREKFSIDNISHNKLLEFIKDILKVLGWGEIDLTSFERDKGVFTVKVKHPTLPSIIRNDIGEKREEPVCHYLRGILKGAFGAILSVENLQIEESTCAATGDSDICVFEAKSTD
ncbi:MAG: V4R domain-containing protein [Candidatus Nanohaloarchaea archaeon]|nr:V4R domain-containing protein [Candidatus Nanohaloarchaea archaeon]